MRKNHFAHESSHALGPFPMLQRTHEPSRNPAATTPSMRRASTFVAKMISCKNTNERNNLQMSCVDVACPDSVSAAWESFSSGHKCWLDEISLRRKEHSLLVSVTSFESKVSNLEPLCCSATWLEALDTLSNSDRKHRFLVRKNVDLGSLGYAILRKNELTRWKFRETTQWLRLALLITWPIDTSKNRLF